MSSRVIRALVVCGVATLAVTAAAAEDHGSDVLAKKLAEFQGADRGEVSAVPDQSVATAFPNHHFYVLRFRQYPRAVQPPAPLHVNNLFAVKPDSSVEQIGDIQGLEGFFRGALAPVTTAGQAKVAATAWLRLAEEFHQDGFFQFSIPDDSLQTASEPDGRLKITGKAIVTQQGGGAGEIVGSLIFDKAGNLVKASEVATLKKGIRPICQATKLLDPDPVVRGMAEQALLVMGTTAKAYLEEQRARASAELQAAIDRIWQRILTEDR